MHLLAWACVMLVVMVLARAVVIPVRMRVVQYVVVTAVMLVWELVNQIAQVIVEQRVLMAVGRPAQEPVQ